jgi:beta-glucanase (GH16 family)
MQTADSPEWKLIWSDEFDGNAVNPDKWDFDLGNGFYDYRVHQWIAGWGNEELQYYTKDLENVQVRDSCLHIRAVKAPMNGCGYTSARLKTKARDGRLLFGTVYGRVAVRAKVPWGKGLWPAIWMLPVEDKYGGWAASGEIDLMEIVGEVPTEVLNSLHFGSSFPHRSLVTTTYKLPEASTVADWHTYAVEWDPGELRFYVDEVQTCTYKHWWSCSKLEGGRGVEATHAGDLNLWPAPFDQAFYLLMNIAVGGNFPGHPNDQTVFPAELVVDWVRVHERVGGQAALAPRGQGAMPWEPGHVSERRS